MFKDCTMKYYKDKMTDEKVCIIVTYPNNANGSHRELSVPISNDNTDYQNILKWAANGNTIQEAD